MFSGAHSSSCGRARVCHPVDQSRIRLGRGTPQEKEIERASRATVAIRLISTVAKRLARRRAGTGQRLVAVADEAAPYRLNVTIASDRQRQEAACRRLSCRG